MIASTFQALIVPSAAQPSKVSAANALNDQGVQMWQLGRRSDAMGAFARAAAADQQFAVPWHNRGAVFLIEGQFSPAISDLIHASRLAPGWTLPRSHLAQAYLRAGDTSAALATSDAARSLDPSLPDVRSELRTLLQARLRMATAVAARRRMYFIITLAAAIVITILTAGIAFASLALPIYRFALFSQARRQRTIASQQLRLLDAIPAFTPAPGQLVGPRPTPSTATVLSSATPGTYVSAGALPPFAASELDPRAPSGSRFRRTGWTLLVLSVLACVLGVASLIGGNDIPTSQLQADFGSFLDWGALSLFGIGCIFVGAILVGAALLVGATAAFRRRRFGWAASILIVGGIGVFFLIIPAQLITVLYLVAMPYTPSERGLEFIPVPQVSLGQE